MIRAACVACLLFLAGCGGGDGPTTRPLPAPPPPAPTPPSPEPVEPAERPVPFPDSDPEWLTELAADYPHVHHVANVRVFSDIGTDFSTEHAEHLRHVWNFFDDLYAENRGSYVDVYYTTQSEVFRKVVPHCPTIFIPNARNLTACYLDYPRWFIIPYQIPDFGTQLHEIGHDFLYATWPESEAYPWFKEGSAMYFEGGQFSDDGSLRVPGPLSYCTTLFRRYDQQHDLIPLDSLLYLEKAGFLADNERTYSQSCMLFHYLEQREPGVRDALIDRINAGRFSSNEDLVAALLELTSKTILELEEAYEAHAR